MRRFFGRILGDRRVAGGLFLILELIAVMWGVGWMSERWPSVTPALTILSFVIVVWLVRKYDNPTYKITWIIIILLFPLFGGLFYLFWGNTPFNRARTQHQYEPNPPDFTDYMRKPATEELSQLHPRHAARTRYIDSLCGMPAWTNTEAHYFRAGEDMFASMCEELEKAERFIFLEYFIIEEGRMWNTILDILARKAKEGLDVRIIYDDVGSIATLPQHYDRYLVSLGIRAVRFNRFIPTLNTYLNYRNHRKMMIIDGNVGYMGGINLADEYINGYEKHGHWKDTAILLKGEAVFSLTTMFLSMWDYLIKKEGEDYAAYYPDSWDENAQGIVQPFADNPLDDEAVGETVYLNLINKAKRYVYITTPYLILSNEMVTAMNTAAKSGVHRIITPHVPDKWYVHAVSRSYYEMLVEAGVKIYEYTPGFVHAKTFVVDDEYAVVGTINLDYRSLYLHFECAAWMYKASCVTDVRDDFLKTQQMSQEITLEECRNISIPRRLGRSVLRVLAPLM